MKLILLLLFISNFAIANCNNKFLPINYVDFSTNLVNSKDNINILKLYKQEDNKYTLLNTNFETTITHMGSIEQINSSKEIYFSNVILSISKSDIKLSIYKIRNLLSF